MRPIAPSDISVAARMLLVLPQDQRGRAISTLIAQAEAADRYQKRMGHPHPVWGNGSLEGAARGHTISPPQSYAETDYLTVMARVLTALVEHRTDSTKSRVSSFCA